MERKQTHLVFSTGRQPKLQIPLEDKLRQIPRGNIILKINNRSICAVCYRCKMIFLAYRKL